MTLAIHHLGKDQEIKDLPDTALPFYVLANEGLFLRKNTLLGTSFLKVDDKAMPSNLGELGFKKGYFTWEASRIPPELCAQIVSFFRRIWEKHHTEAEVMLTAKIEDGENGKTKISEWRVFVPSQKVSMSGVDFAYEPTHIARGHMVVGTMHSHCNFSAFHSGTDTNDAAGMDGVHFTVGFVDRKDPQVVGMVTINGVNFEFKPEALADFSQLDAATAPAWWDNYVTPNAAVGGGHKPVGYNNFERYQKPSSSYGGWGGRGGYQRDYGSDGSYQDYHRKQEGNPPYSWTPGSRPPQGSQTTIGDMMKGKAEESALLPDDTKKKNTPIVDPRAWEDRLPREVRMQILETDVLTDEDYILLDDKDYSTVAGVDNQLLRLLFLRKVRDISAILKHLGVELNINLSYDAAVVGAKNAKKIRRFTGNGRSR